MGQLNILRADWTGKVGKTVGAKWKDKSTIRTYAIPSDPKTKKQETVRDVFGEINHLVALFSDSLKYINSLDTKGMSVRNAIVKLNKDQIEDGTFTPATLMISKGGLQKPQGATFTQASAGGKVSATWEAPTATNFTSKAKAVLVVVQPDDEVADVVEVAVTALTAESSINFDASGPIYAYLYFYDMRGTSKVGSVSVASEVTAASKSA